MKTDRPPVFSVDASGRIPQARYIASPNCDPRPDGMPVELLVIHNISLPPQQFGGNVIVELFTNPLNLDEHTYYREIHRLRVSSHFLIRRDGELIQFVSCRERAWHAGLSSWQGRPRCNDFSLGIELEGCDDLPFEPLQYGCVVDLLRRLCASYPIAAVVGHSDISPGRKTDPGPRFDWHRLAAFGKLPGVLC